MFRSLIAFSLRQPVLVLLLAACATALAGYQILHMPVDVFPELNAPTVVVLTEAAGLAADEVEQYVTFPIESSVSGLPGMRRVRSSSAIGLSLVWVEFEWGEDIYRARTLVAEKLAAIRASLPERAHAEITPITSITGEILLLSLSSPGGENDPMQVRAYAEFDLRNLLLSVPGVAQVVAIGGELPEYQVHVRQEQLALFELSMEEVVDAVRDAHSTAGAGYLPNVDGREIPIRQTGRVRSAADIAATVVRFKDGTPITVGQVAEVAIGATPQRGTAAEGGRSAVVLSVQKAPSTNTLLLTSAIDAMLDQAEQTMPQGMVLNRHVMRQSDFIRLSVNNLVVVLRDAAIFVALILVLFLMNVRTTLITLTALPLSLGIAFLVLSALGLSINVMTLGGLAVAIGELVDDAIIDVENVFRRLRENAALPHASQRPVLQVVFHASNEIRSSVVFATLIICLVFVPLLFLQGLEGRFFRPLGIAYIVSTFASLVVALTVTPVLCRLLLGNARFAAHGDGALVRFLKRRYEPALRWAIRRGKLLFASSALITGACLGLASTYGSSFLPEFNEGTFTVFLMAPPGTSLTESNRLAFGIESQLREIDGVRSVVRRTGRAERDEHAEPVSSSEIEVTVKPGRDKFDVRREIDRVLAGVPGITTSIGQPIEHRLSHVLSGTPAAIAIVVQGEDLAVLRGLAKEIEAVLKELPGTRDVAANREVMITSLPVRYRLQDLATIGLSPVDAAEQVQDALMGETVAEVNEGVRRFAITVRLHPEQRERVADVGNLLLRGPMGSSTRLRDVADIGREATSNLIAREGMRRKAVISCNVAEGYNLGQLAEAVRERIEPMVTQKKCTLKVGGQFEAQQSASRTLLAMGAGVILFMLILIQTALGSLRAAILVMVNLPLALIGGILAVYIAESPSLVGNTLALLGIGAGRYQAPVLSIASLVGFITLFGIAVRNGILLVRHYFDLMREGASLDEAVIRGSMERLVPILMTALTAALGLFPIVLAAGEPGSEILAPLSVVVLGGLLSSTFLNLILVPAGFFWMFRNHPVGADAQTSDLEALT
ncbi:MAG: efflux RND transporter permease subunit [Candidatus Eisenbacteria bacterium]|nr:efflux RND transporter permease subunit [Candidatus Eisenbacteria bacterium]